MPSSHLVAKLPELRDKLHQGYVDDIMWKKTLDVLAANDELPLDDQADLPFVPILPLSGSMTHRRTFN